MTERLYYDSDALQFDAHIVGFAGDQCRVVLDRTAFYPTSGGQPHDTGVLGGAQVIDVVEHDDEIVHLLNSPLELGPVRGTVDAKRRRDFTIQHSAQHLLSALADDRFGWPTTSVHFGSDHATIEFATESISVDQLGDLERWAAESIAAALPVAVSYLDGAAATGLRKPTQRTGTIRVVSIGEIDRSACGGTHVTSTAQLGSVLLLTPERIRGQFRVPFLAGARVMALFRHQQTLLRSVALELSCAPDEVLGLVQRRKIDLKVAAQRIEALETQLTAMQAEQLVAASGPPDAGIRKVILPQSATTLSELRLLAQHCASIEGVLFVGTLADPATIVVGSNRNSGIHAGKQLKQALSVVGGKGGGSSQLAQGTVPSAALLATVVAAVTGSG
jgi:alanyl-tRNA synthetase